MHPVRRLIAVASCALVTVLFSACSPAITLDSWRYQPNLAANAAYAGRTIELANFENTDNDTSIFFYRGSDSRRYGGPVLTSYFWYCFRTAFERLGMRVYEPGTAPPGTPTLEVRMLQVNENVYRLGVHMRGAPGTPVLNRVYETTEPLPAKTDAATLEARAYRMMDAVFLAMVSDPAFQSALAGGAARAPTR